MKARADKLNGKNAIILSEIGKIDLFCCFFTLFKKVFFRLTLSLRTTAGYPHISPIRLWQLGGTGTGDTRAANGWQYRKTTEVSSIYLFILSVGVLPLFCFLLEKINVTIVY